MLPPEALTPTTFEEVGRLIAGGESANNAVASSMPATDSTERRRQQRRQNGLRLRGFNDLQSPGRRADDRIAALRLRRWFDAGALG